MGRPQPGCTRADTPCPHTPLFRSSGPAGFGAPLRQDVVRAGIGAAVRDADGSRARPDEPATLFSPAGHDAMAIGGITDVGMLFLRNPDGISHHPEEAVSAGDVGAGLRALAESGLHLAAEPRSTREPHTPRPPDPHPHHRPQPTPPT